MSKENDKIRKRKSYKMFEEFYENVQQTGPAHATKMLHEILDEKHAYGYRTNALYAGEALQLLLKDKGHG